MSEREKRNRDNAEFSVANLEAELRTANDRSVEASAEILVAVDALAKIAGESLRLVSSLQDRFAVDQALSEALGGKVSYFSDSLRMTLKKAGIEIADLEGAPYSAGLDVVVMNLEDFEPGDDLFVDAVVEPLFFYTPPLDGFSSNSRRRPLKPGRVTVRKKDVL